VQWREEMLIRRIWIHRRDQQALPWTC
jgi:hypothetical protein